jgi:L-amino acid N-acyltransferase YncA
MTTVRLAKVEDCQQIQDIYQYYVLNTAVTFEYEVPSVEEMGIRMNNILLKYPYLVAELENKILCVGLRLSL